MWVDMMAYMIHLVCFEDLENDVTHACYLERIRGTVFVHMFSRTPKAGQVKAVWSDMNLRRI